MWIKNAPSFGTCLNEAIENFVNKYSTTYQTMLKIDIQNMQIHHHKWTCRKKHKHVCQFHFQFQKPPMKSTKVLLPLEEGECIVDLCQTTTTIFKQLVNMGLSEDNSFDKFLTNMCLNQETYILTLRCTLQKPTLFLKCCPNDIWKNVFGIHTGPLW